MLSPDFIAIIGVGIALAALILHGTWRTDSKIEKHLSEAAADRRAFQASMDQHQRSFQASMDQHRRDMQRLGERQAFLEGNRATPPRPEPSAAE
ncbi:MAG: hypothetical protein OXI64_05965 [Defluviicoccus sp.]|nr:hypothetical protein [Defluviicoccus sp.]